MAISPTTLQTERLVLRPPRMEDADDYFGFASDPDYAFFAFRVPVTREYVEQLLARAVAGPWSDRPGFMVVHEGRVIGSIQLDIDHLDRLASLGYGIARAHRGKGLATEAARAVLDYGFRAFALAKVWARADPRNVASVRVLEKLGMQREGLLRQHLIRRGERVDRVCYGLLREEWPP